MKVSGLFVKQSLSAHSWIGLLASTLMYIVCLTGTLCVFYPEFQRWEKASVDESLAFEISALQKGVNDAIANEEILTSHMYVYLPTEERPFLSLANEKQDWYVNHDGSLGNVVESKWTDFLIDMHLYLTIPNSVGMMLVSTLGAMLCALIISGLFAHPRIFKDAFKLRLSSGTRLEQVDIHNRLSVWGTPFYLLIAITGAYFGLVSPLLGVVSAVTGKDPVAVTASVFGEEPQLNLAGPLDLETAFTQMTVVAPDADPFLIVVHEAGTPSQFFTIMARHPQRMIYSENYQFDAAGRYLGKVGFSDGEAGRQIVYSMYYLHFGHFAGYLGKAIYFILGIALTIVSVTGVNIWLAKRKKRDQINLLWLGVVWGVPASLEIALLTALLFDFVSVSLFWVSLVTTFALVASTEQEADAKKKLLTVNAVLVALILLTHITIFGSAAVAGAALIINSLILALLIALIAAIWRPNLTQLLLARAID